MIARTIVASALLVVLVLLAAQVPSAARIGEPTIPAPQEPAASLVMTVNFTVRDFQPQIDRSGPINWIARNPTNLFEVFAASISGGVWRSTDGGNNWTPLRSLQPWSVSAVAFLFDGTPGGAILVTTREDFRIMSGAGVWRSDDRGESWTQVARVPNTCPDVPRAHGIAVNGTSVYVATSCGVLQSADGRRFGKVDAVVFPTGFDSSPSPERFYSVEVNNSGDVLLGGEAGLFYRFRPALSARPRSGMFGDNGAFRRAFAVTPSRRYPNFVLAVAGRQPEPPIVYPPLLISQDSGQTWTEVASSRRGSVGAGGSPFVRIFPAREGSPDLFVYYGDTYALWRAGPFRGGDLSSLADSGPGTWTQVDPIGHADPHDIDFVSQPGVALDLRRLLLATDGGLEICSFGTASFGLPTCHYRQILDVSSGLSSIQVMNVKGQIIGSGESAKRRLYLATWHTDLWASKDNGVSWESKNGEAAWLDMERRISTASDAQIVSNYNPRPYTLYDDLLTNGVNFMEATSAISPPLMLQRGVFVQTVNDRVSTSLFAAANVTRATVTRPDWVRVANLKICPPLPSLPCSPLSTTDPPILAGYIGPDAVVYQPYDAGLAIVSGIVVSAGRVRALIRPRYSQMKWAGPSGTQPVLQGIGWTPNTGFGKYPVIAADPLLPSHLVIPDIRNSKVMRSLNGGDTWNPIIGLNDAVTRDATGAPSFIFGIDRGNGTQSLVSSISFYPEYPNLVILGTVENGLFFSTDRAVTWQRIPNTEHITNVVALYWRSANSVIVGSFGRGLFEIQMRYTLPRSSLGIVCGDCSFLPAGPRVAGINSTRIVPVSLQSTSDLKQQNFDEAVLVLDGRINGVEVNQGRLEKLWVTTGSNEYRFSGANSNSKFVTEERSGFVGFKGLPIAEQLRNQGQVIKGITFSNGIITNLIYGPSESPIPVPQSLGPVKLPQDTTPQLMDPYLRIFGPEVGLGTMGVGKSFDLQGHLFRPDTTLELRLDGKVVGSQLRTDRSGRFATRLTAPSTIGPHTIVVRQLVGSGTVQAGIGFSVNNSDKRQETSSTKGESANIKLERANEKSESPNEKKDPNQKERFPGEDDKKEVAPVLVTLPLLLTANDLIGAAKASGGRIQLVSMASAKSPDAKSLDWIGVSPGDQLTVKLELPSPASVGLYASFLGGPQAGSLRVLVNGKELGEQMKLTIPQVLPVKLLLDKVDLRQGTNTITFIVMPSQTNQPIRLSLLGLSLEK